MGGADVCFLTFAHSMLAVYASDHPSSELNIIHRGVMCLLVFGLDDDDAMERYEYCNHWLLPMCVCVYIHIFVPKDMRQSDLFSCNKKYPVPPNAHECTTHTQNHQTHQTQKYHRSHLMRIVVTATTTTSQCFDDRVNGRAALATDCEDDRHKNIAHNFIRMTRDVVSCAVFGVQRRPLWQF